MQPQFIDITDLVNKEIYREKGRDARMNNIDEAITLARSLEGSFGPKGLRKMIDGAVVYRGARILEAISPDHPVQKMMVDVAKNMEKKVGDATITTTLLAGFLLLESRKLIQKGVNPSAVLKGLQLAEEWAKESLEDLVVDTDVEDPETIENILKTSLDTGNGLGKDALEVLSDLFLFRGDDFDPDRIRVETEVSDEKNGVRLINGLRIDVDLDTDETRIADPKLLLLKGDLKQRKTKLDMEYKLETVEAVREAVDIEKQMLDSIVKSVIRTGANVILCSGEVNDIVRSRLKDNGILVAEKVKETDLKECSRATGSRITAIEDLGNVSGTTVGAVVIEGDNACVGGVCGV